MRINIRPLYDFLRKTKEDRLREELRKVIDLDAIVKIYKSASTINGLDTKTEVERVIEEEIVLIVKTIYGDIK